MSVVEQVGIGIRIDSLIILLNKIIGFEKKDDNYVIIYTESHEFKVCCSYEEVRKIIMEGLY